MAFTIIINETETTKTLRTFDCYCRSAQAHARIVKCAEEAGEEHRTSHTDRVIHTGTITLPNGETVRDGQGAAYHIGSDSYPFTILGWTKTGKTVFFQKAERRRIATDCPEDQRYLFAADSDGKIEAAKWTTRRGHSFYAAGRCGAYTTDGFSAYADPHR